MKRSMNDLARLVKVTATPSSHDLQPHQPMTLAAIDGQLSDQLGRPGMGWFKNLAAKRHDAQKQLDTRKKISSAKYHQLGELAIKALKAEVRLIEEKLKIDFNREYAALAERSAAGEMEVVRKLEAVLEVGRDLLYGDRADVIERLEARLEAGLLSDKDFETELKHLFDRYSRLLDEFVEIVDERRDGVRTAYRSTTHE